MGVPLSPSSSEGQELYCGALKYTEELELNCRLSATYHILTGTLGQKKVGRKLLISYEIEIEQVMVYVSPSRSLHISLHSQNST